MYTFLIRFVGPSTHSASDLTLYRCFVVLLSVDRARKAAPGSLGRQTVPLAYHLER